MRVWRESLVVLRFCLVFVLCSAGDNCGSKEKLVRGGEEVEQICDPLKGEQNCVPRLVSHIRINTTEKGACHCADGLYRHSNGSCLTLRECGYSFDKSPCAAHERTLFYDHEMQCDGSAHFKTITREPRTIYCHCPIGQIRLNSSTCISIEECKKLLSPGRVLPYLKLNTFVRPEPPAATTPLPKIDRCGNNEKLVFGGEPKEQICDVVWVNCKRKKYVEVRQTENGACHCTDGRFRHSNGACLTLRECGFHIDKTPCPPHEHTVLTDTYEEVLDDRFNVFYAYPKNIHCHCAEGLIRYKGKCVTDCKKDSRFYYPVGSCKEPEYFDDANFTTTVQPTAVSYASNSSSSSLISTTKATTYLTAKETTVRNAIIDNFNDKINKMNTSQSQPSLPRSQGSELQPKTALPQRQTLSSSEITNRKQTTSTTKSTTTQPINTRSPTHIHELNDKTNKMKTTQSQPSLPRSQGSELQPKTALPQPQTLSPTHRKSPTSTAKSTTKQLTNTRQQTHIPELNDNTNKMNACIFVSAGLGALAVFGALLVIMWHICEKRSERAAALRATDGERCLANN